MKKALFFAATAIFFASCDNKQETANQAKIDAMSQELTKQHIIDSMNAVTPVGASALEANVPVVQGHRSSSSGHSHTNSRATHSDNPVPVGSAPVTAPVSAAPPVATNTVTGPTAAEIEAKRKEDNRKKAKSAAAGAAIGAGAGAIGGAISGKNEHFKKENAVIGAGVGAAVGAGAGLLFQNRKLKKERERDTTQH